MVTDGSHCILFAPILIQSIEELTELHSLLIQSSSTEVLCY